jgi:ABC-type multidrug transport system permease subunit
MIKPIIASILSLVFAGLGHLFLRQYGLALLFAMPASFLWKLTDYYPQMLLGNIILFIVAAVDAFSFGKRGIGIF